jgi:hypothetical protein
MSKTIIKQVLQRGKLESSIAFCIVHWNAPDFLFLNVSQLESLYPDCSILVLDNRSKKQDMESARKNLKQFNNVTFFSAALKPWSLVKIFGLDDLFLSYTHSKGLQFLLNYAAKKQIEIAVFLDQDCILNRKIDPLIQKIGDNIWVVGARDYVVIPKDYEPLRKVFWTKPEAFGDNLRYARNMIHASFMILKPVQIRQVFGDLSLIEEGSIIKSYQRACGLPFAVVEPYYGISIRTAGRILFLETRMHDTIPLLTSYSNEGIVYAWHAWFSSRTTGFLSHQMMDGLPVRWLSEARKGELEFMQHVYEETSSKHNKSSTT